MTSWNRLRDQAARTGGEHAVEPRTRETNEAGRAKRPQDECRVGLTADVLNGKFAEGVDDQATECFEDLVRKHRTPLYSAALRLTHDWATAEDLVQDTLERAYRAFHRYRPEGKARAWLGCIMQNLWITECRRPQSVRRAVSLDGAEDLPPYGRADDASSASSVEAFVLGELGVASILSAIDSLPCHQRQVVILTSLQGVPYATIAEALVLPVGTVASRLSRARRQLLELLQDQDHSVSALDRAN